MRILLFGPQGNLGEKITAGLRSRGLDLDAVGRAEYDILLDTRSTLRKIVDRKKYDLVINCSALIGIKNCEIERSNAYKINANFPNELAQVFNENLTKIVHFSTDNVFECVDPNENHSESGLALPTTWYGVTKLIGERSLDSYKNRLVIRLPLLFSKNINDQKLTVNQLLRKLTRQEDIFVYKDVYNTPFLIELVEPFLYNEIITRKHDSNLIHITGDSRITLYDMIMRLGKIRSLDLSRINPVSVGDMKPDIIKPRFGGLSSNFIPSVRLDGMLDILKGSSNEK